MNHTLFSKFCIRLVVVIIIMNSSSYIAQTKGGRWVFENNGNDEATWDEVNNQGSLSGAAFYQNINPIAQGDYYLSLEDSADYGAFTVADNSELDFLDENFAASLWAYPVSGYDNPQFLFMKGDRSGAVKVNNYALRINNGYIEFIVHSESGANSVARSSFKIVNNEWTFLAVFYDYNQSKLYFWNNAESFPIDTVEFNAPLFPNDIKLYIGTSGQDGYKRFWGRIDDLRISNKVSDILDNSTGVELSTIISLPSNYLLNQNYPNPFNPTTTISYEIPAMSNFWNDPDKDLTGSDGSQAGQNVSIRVYDVLGNEITTLINEYHSPGHYEIEFNAGNLPSGIYFYRLQAGDPSTNRGQGFAETKRMILLK